MPFTFQTKVSNVWALQVSCAPQVMLIPGCGAARAVPASGQGYTTAAQQAVGLEMVQT